jgi:hypothetical protein
MQNQEEKTTQHTETERELTGHMVAPLILLNGPLAPGAALCSLFDFFHGELDFTHAAFEEFDFLFEVVFGVSRVDLFFFF